MRTRVRDMASRYTNRKDREQHGMTKTKKVAVIGLGHWYSAYGLARALPEYPGATLVAAASPEAHKLEAFTVDVRRPRLPRLPRAARTEEVDIVHIATPVSEMAEVAIAAARAGKHMVLGKPMAMTVDEADRMVEAVEAAGVACFPFQAIGRLRTADLVARIRGGEIGEVAVIHQTCRWSIAEDWYQSGQPGWFADPRFVPGGAFIDEGIYWIDFFRYLTGSEIVRVEARMANLVHTDIAVEDWGMATFTFANGVHRHARGLMDHQRAAQERSVTQTERGGPAGGRGLARRGHRSVVPLARPGRARRRRRRLGVRAPARSAGVRAAGAVSAQPPDRLPDRAAAADRVHPRSAGRVRRGDGGVRIGEAGEDQCRCGRYPEGSGSPGSGSDSGLAGSRCYRIALGLPSRVLTMRVALAQLNPVSGDIDGNADEDLRRHRRGRPPGGRSVVAPEMVLPGYCIGDLIENVDFLAANDRAIERIARGVARHHVDRRVHRLQPAPAERQRHGARSTTPRR